MFSNISFINKSHPSLQARALNLLVNADDFVGVGIPSADWHMGAPLIVVIGEALVTTNLNRLAHPISCLYSAWSTVHTDSSSSPTGKAQGVRFPIWQTVDRNFSYSYSTKKDAGLLKVSASQGQGSE